MLLQRCAALVAAAGLVVTVACAQTDAGITTAVKAKFAADDTVKAYQVNVDTRNGVVTLSGDVETATAKEQAIRIARETGGVRDVIDQIQVNEAAATGGVLDRDFAADFDTLERKAERGTAEVKEEARQAGETIRDVSRDAATKAADTSSKAAAKTAAVLADAGITSAVKSKLLADTAVRGLAIDVDTDAGVVTLNGSVSSRAEADRAIMLARKTEGVTRVVDNMRVGR